MWVAQLVKCLTFNLSSGHELMVIRVSPTLGSVLTAQSLLEILSLPLSLPLPCLLSLSNKEINIKRQKSKVWNQSECELITKALIFSYVEIMRN